MTSQPAFLPALLESRSDYKVPATSSRGRYSLAPDFAELLDPALTGDDFTQSAREWQDRNLTMTARLRAQRARDAVRASHAIAVTLPGGGSRNLLPGQSSIILKGVIKEWTKMLDDPVVVFISQSGEKVNVLDGQLLAILGAWSLARKSYVWFLDEPDALLSWSDLPVSEFDEL